MADADGAAPPTDYSPGGVDRTLIRWMLGLTPAERLQFLQDRMRAIHAIRERNDVKSYDDRD